MSLLDLLDKQYGGSQGTSTRSTGVGSIGSPLGGMQPRATQATAEQAAANSRERGAPERVDINDFVNGPNSQDGAMQALEIAGKAPGWVLERPLAAVQTAGKAAGFDVEGTIGSVPILGNVLGVAGDIFTNISGIPAAVANASIAEGLKRGTNEGWEDDKLVPVIDNWDAFISQLPGVGALSGLLGNKPLTDMTWGDFKAHARKRGWNDQDVQDLVSETRAPWDYGDRQMVEDGLGDVALRLVTDPTNLLFGAGAMLKIPKGIGLLGKMVGIGAELEKPLSISASAARIAQADHLGATWLGLGKHFGEIGRVAGAIPGGTAAVRAGAKGATLTGKGLKAYKKTALGLSAAQLGIAGVDELTGGKSRPSNGFLEPLFEANRAIFDNQPLSQNTAFSIFSAFHIGPHNVLGPAWRTGKTAVRTFDQRNTRPAILDALSEGQTGTRAERHAAALEAIGGEEGLNNLIYHVHSRQVFEQIFRNPALKAALETAGSLDESALANAKVRELVDLEIAAGLKEGRISSRKTVQALKDWHAHRDGVKHSVEFPWDGVAAATRWTEYTTAAGPVSRIFQERAAAVIGLADAVSKVDLEIIRASFRVDAVNGAVPITSVRRMLSRYPQLLELDKGRWEQYLLRSADGTTVPMQTLHKQIGRALKDAPTLREITHEAAAAEAAAARIEADAPPPVAPENTLLHQQAIADRAVEGGGAFLNASRMRDPIKTRLTRKFKLGFESVADVQVSRDDPYIAKFEDNVGEALADQGFPVDSVSQATGIWEGKLEPSVEIEMASATLDELRLAAATVGKNGQQDAVALSITGPRIAQLGLKPNGVEVVWALPTTNPAVLEAVNGILKKDFMGATLNDTTGVIRILADADTMPHVMPNLERVTAEIEALLPRDMIGETGLRHSIHKAYIEFPAKEGTLSYDGIIRQARTDKDPRAGAYLRTREALAHKRPGPGVAAPGDGSGPRLGREPGDDGLVSRDLAQPASDRVGLGARDSVTTEPGFLYRTVAPERLEGIAADGLRTVKPDPTGSWADGGVGARQYMARELLPSTEDTKGHVVLRVAESGRVINDRVNSQPYVMRRLRPSELEIWGADGQWHPVDSWFEPPLEPAIVDAASSVAPAYSPITSANFGRKMADAFGGDDAQAAVYSALGEAMANAWSSRTGRPAAEWYHTTLAGIESGEGAGTLNQIAAREQRLAVAVEQGGDVHGLIEEPVPDVLAQHGLGGESALEWVELNGQSYGIPGGVEGLATGEFTMWDLWRLKAQGINPGLLPDDIRMGLYTKLFRSQMRALDNPVDAFNRVAFAALSPLTNLTQNEALLTFVRARDMDGIARLADIADRVETAAKAAGKSGGQINSEIGFAVQQAVGLLDFDRGVKSIPTNGALASVAKAARIFRDNPEFFKLRAGEDLVQYSERLMNVLPGADMKVGNFAAMLGNPFAFDRGTIDSHMVEVLANEGRVPADVAKRLVKIGADGKNQGDAPKGRKITYRMADGSYHPDLPEHLRDLPIEPAGNKVTIYDGDYKILNEALKAKFAESGMGDTMGLGGYQWYEWDLKRGKFEPHTVIYPGSHELPPIETSALAGAIDAHREMGYFNRTSGLSGTAVSPTRALYYQTAPTPSVHTEMVSVEALRGAIRENREVHPRVGPGATSLDELTSSIERNGFDPTRPIMLRYDPTHHRVIIDDGNHRIAAAIRLGLTEVPVIVRSAGPQPKVRAGSMRLPGQAVDAPAAQVFAPSKIGLEGRPVQSRTLYQREVDPMYESSLASARVKADAAERSARGHMETGNVKEAQRYQAEADRWRRAEQEYLNKPRLNQEGPSLPAHAREELLNLRPRSDVLFGEGTWKASVRKTQDGDLVLAVQRGDGDKGIIETIQARDFDAPEVVVDRAVARMQEYLGSDAPGGRTIIKGTAELLDSGQSVIRGVTNPDFSTGVHELWHAAQGHIDPADLAVMEGVYGIKDGVWLIEHQERSARDFERYIRNGIAPTPELQPVFQKMKVWLTAVYARLKGSPIEKQIHPEIKAVFDRALTELPPELRPVPRPDPLTVGLRAMEDNGRPALHMDETALRAELASLTRDTVLNESEAARAQDIQRRLEAAILAKGERTRGAVLFNAQRDAQVSRSIPLHRSLEDRPVEVKADLERLQADLTANYGPYVLKAPPKLAQFYDRNAGDLIAEHLKAHGAVGEVLANWGVFGKMNRLIEWLTAPVENNRLGNAALQALYNELLPKGATTREVRAFVKALNQESHLHTIGPFEIRTFKNGTSLTQQAINKIAAGDKLAGLPAIFSDKAIAAIGQDGFTRALDRASNRFYQATDVMAAQGGKRGALARGFTKTYDRYQKTTVGSTQRYVSKTMYHWFRFLSDPRWWAMNILEADMLGGMRYGASATRATGAHTAVPTAPSLIHQFGSASEKQAKELSSTLGGADTGWLYTRRLGGYVSRGFDHERPESTLAVLRGMADDDPILSDLRTRFGTADDDIVEGIDKMLYSWDTKGPQSTLIEEAMATLGADETQRLLPFLTKVWQKHEQTYQDVVQTFHGNANRSNLERIGNSYWLYWPLSYQVKATKWLVDVMTHKSFGRETNLAPAAVYATHYENHKERMASDPGYASMFDENPTLWFMAQMLFPITPGDIGVSLSRPVRYAGGKLGLWGEYKNASDPISASGAILSLGPVYTASLMDRVGSEAFDGLSDNLYPAARPTNEAPFGPGSN